MRFRAYDSLRLFHFAARHESLSAAAEVLNLTKGAVSHQIKRLEAQLGFPVFERRHRGVALTEKGARLWQAANGAFGELEREIEALREQGPQRVTVGLSTYFASRWLSPRLMTYIATHPGVALRLQPLIDLIDLERHGIDLVIRWGDGAWTDLEIEPLFGCPAYPTAGAAILERLAGRSLEAALPGLRLLHDRDGSRAWRDWHAAAGLPYRARRDELVVADPNVRVQAVIDGQGIALNDRLVESEVAAGRLSRVSEIELDRYGYFLAYAPGALERPALRSFRDWIVGQASEAGVCLTAGAAGRLAVDKTPTDMLG